MKTVFTDNVTPVVSAWLNLVYNHVHDNLDSDGHAPFIDINQLDDDLRNLLGDLAGIRSLIPLLFYLDKAKTQIFGGTGNDGVYTGGYNLTLPQYEFETFTIPNATNIQMTGGVCRIKVKGDVLINGSLTGVPKNPGGTGKAYYNNGGLSYSTGVSWLGSGGAETVDHTDLSGLTTIRDRGGLGGAGIIIEALGNIVVNGTISANGGNAGVPTILSGSPILGGSGAGSGGSITLQSFSSIQINGTIDLIGGNGGNGVGTNAAGGGGGAGGIFTSISPTFNNLPNSINVNGGAPGISVGAGSNAGGGGGGYGGTGGNSKSAGQAGVANLLTKNIFSFL